MIKMEIKTERLVLREWTKKDKESLIENVNNVKVSRNLLKMPFPYTDKDADFWINECAKKIKEKPREAYEFAVELVSEGRAVGGIGLSGIDDFQNMAEIGYWLGAGYWRQGIMSEAVKAVLDFGFNKLKLRKIFMYAYTENEGSNKIAEKFGFKFEGSRRKHFKDKATGTIHDDKGYGLLKEDWEGKLDGS